MSKYEIKVSSDMEEGEPFVKWLNEHGQSAEMSDSTGNYVDGVCTSIDEGANEIMRGLWEDYCRS